MISEFTRLPAQNRHALPKAFNTPRSLFWVAFLVRMLYVTVAHTYRFPIYNQHFQFGWEMGRIARAMATGYGYADPFAGHSGPTAWVPPLYPLILAGVFKIFGVYTLKSAWVILGVNSLFSALTALTTWEIAARCYSLRVAKWSGWLWALYPAAMQYAVRWVWEMTLTTLLFSWVIVLALRMRHIGDDPFESGQENRLARWLSMGLLWALIGLSNSTLLLFLPVCVLWIIFGSQDRAAAFRGAAFGGLIFLACLAPWFWRNWKAFHAFIPMRSNLGVEMWWWNNPNANAISLGAPIDPYPRDARFMAYLRMGELAYSRHQGALAREYITTHPGRFALLSLKRFYYFWVSVPHPVDNKPFNEGGRELSYCVLSLTGLMGLGLSLKNRAPASWLFAAAFLLLPFTYYFVSVQARFRHPLEPLITIFSVYLFQSATPRRRTLSNNA
jgi:hypothetical protein